MRGIRFLLLLGVVVLGFGPATAQDVFINRYKSDDADKKPSLFIRSSRSESTMVKPRSRSYQMPSRQKDKIKLARDARNVNDAIGIFHAWEKSDHKPETQEEIVSYAQSRMALIEGEILKDEQKLIARLEQNDRNDAKRYARNDFGDRGQRANDGRTQRSAVARPVYQPKTRTMSIQKPTVYRKPGGGSSSTGVFKDYR